MTFHEEVEIDLITELLKFFAIYNVTSEYIKFFIADNYVAQAVGKPAQLQKVFISAFFAREIFMGVQNVDSDVRFALAATGDTLEWIDVNKLVVIPYMITTGLIKIHEAI